MDKIQITPIEGLTFEPIGHTYHYNGKELSGITTALHNQLCPDEFLGISDEVMAKATERGNIIHEDISKFVTTFEDSGSQELQDFIDLAMEYRMNFIGSEVLVTDFENFASAIDLIVKEGPGAISLGDIKTFGTMTPAKMLKLQYQLSIYAYMAELCWPGIKIEKLFCIHLRNVEKADGSFDHIKEIIFVKRIDSDICKALLQAELDGTPFVNPLAEIPVDIQSQGDRIRELILQKQQVEEELSEKKAMILERMESMNIKTWTFDSGLKATRKLPTTRQSFDLARCKKEHPEIDYDSFMKSSFVNGSIQLTI